MPQQTSQSPDKSAAALAFATMLSENLLRQQNPAQMEESMQPMGQASLEEEQVEQPMEEVIEEPEAEEVELEEEPEEELEEEPTEEPETGEPETDEEKSSFLDEVKSTIEDGFESIKKLFKRED